MSLINCFENIIGFTRAEDDCVDGYSPVYSESLSGLFIDELQGMSLRILDSTGGSSDIWQKLVRSRENAINYFTSDILREMDKYTEPIRKRFFGDAGSRSFTRLMPENNFYGLRMYSDVVGGEYTLSGVTLILDSTEDVDLLIYDNYDLLYTIPVSSVAGRPNRVNFDPLSIDLDGNYYFLIQPTGRPYKNKLTCGCGGYKWCFRPDTPCYRYSRDKWTEWAMIGGISGADVSEREDWGIAASSTGMILHGTFTCDPISVICSDSSDFLSNEVDRSIAWAILYKTAEFLTNYILDTDEVSRYTLLGKEVLIDNREHYNNRYATMVDYISRNVEIDKNECLRCRSPHGMGKRSQRL